MLLGVQPSEIDRMTLDETLDILNIHAAEQRARAEAQRNASRLAMMMGR